jgi:hypothetical protein
MERQTFEYIVAALIGVAVFIVIGYFAQGDSLSFSYWFKTPKPGPWALLGVFVGLGVRFIRR